MLCSLQKRSSGGSRHGARAAGSSRRPFRRTVSRPPGGRDGRWVRLSWAGRPSGAGRPARGPWRPRPHRAVRHV